MTQLHFVDTETFGLDPERHALFEIAVAPFTPKDTAYDFWLEPSDSELARADAYALNLTRFYERRRELHDPDAPTTAFAANYLHFETETLRWAREQPGRSQLVRFGERQYLAYWLAAHLDGNIAGNVISFDALRLERWIRGYGAAPRWHYHLVDVEAFVAGALGQAPPWSSEKLSEAVGVKPPGKGALHTALADAEWSRELFRAVLGYTSLLAEA